MKKTLFTFLLLAALLLSACGAGKAKDGPMQDGYYSAEAAEYVNGWKEFVTIFVRDGKILSVEYNAKNASGFIKSWDMDYMRTMQEHAGNYPNRYTRGYGAQLLEAQTSDGVDGMSGATRSYGSFLKLSQAAIDCSRAGDAEVAIVPTT